jgi:hypothetical protein
MISQFGGLAACINEFHSGVGAACWPSSRPAMLLVKLVCGGGGSGGGAAGAPEATEW